MKLSYRLEPARNGRAGPSSVSWTFIQESCVVLRGRLRGYAVGLVQLFRDVPCPDLLARHLLDLELGACCR